MRSTEPFPEHGVDPLTPLAQAAGWLASTAAHLALGLVIGLLVARVLRARHVHWTWAACLSGLLTFTHSVLGRHAITVLAAAYLATLSARATHRRDLDAGGDLAAIAVARHRPLDVMRSRSQQLALVCRTRLGRRTWFRRGELIVGRTRAGNLVSLPFGDSSGGTHTLVLGATGSGKTVTQAWLALRAIEHGHGAIVIDPKGDLTLREHVARAARQARREFIHWTPSGPCVYNPYAHGSETEIADKVLAGERFTEPHYLRQAQRYLGHVIRALRASGGLVSLAEIVKHLDPAALELLARTLPETAARGTHAYLDALTPRQRADLAGIRDRLAILVESDAGAWLDPRAGAGEDGSGGDEAVRMPSGRPPSFDLHAAVLARAVVYFELQADSRPLLTQMLGSAIVQDLLTTVAALQRQPTPTLVLIDEFSAIAAEHVVRLFGRARSAGVSLVLGTQELSDLRPPGRERLLDQVMGNLTALIAHRQVVPESAALIAALAGTSGGWRTARHSDGRTTRTRTRHPVLDAGELMELRRGWAALIVLTDGCRSSVARIFSPH